MNLLTSEFLLIQLIHNPNEGRLDVLKTRYLGENMYNDRFAFITLFNVVNERYSKEYVDKTGWMYSHQWNSKQRDEFVVWLAAELVTRNIFNNEKDAQREAMFWTARNGWQMNEKLRARAA